MDSSRERVYAVHRPLYRDLAINNDGLLPTHRLSSVDQRTGEILAAVELGAAVNGAEQGIAVDAMRNRIFVPNADDDTVTIVDGASHSLMSTVRAGKSPQGIAVDPAAGLVFVANAAGRSLTVLDAAGVHVRTIELDAPAYSAAFDPRSRLVYVSLRAAPWTIVAVNPRSGAIQGRLELPFLFSLQAIAVDPGSRLYVPDYNSGLVSVIDISAGALKEVNRFPAGTFPTSAAVDSSNGNVLVAESGNDRINVFDRAGSPVRSIPARRLPVAIAIDESSRQAYVANALSGSLSKIDLIQQGEAETYPLGVMPVSLAVDSAGGRIFAANYTADSISVIDAGNGTLRANWPAGAGPWSVAVDPGIGQLYSLNVDEGALAILSLTDGRLLAKVPTGPSPVGMVAVSPATNRVYVTGSNGLSIVDGITRQILKTTPVGNRPMGVAVSDAAGLVYVASQQSGLITIVDAATGQVLGSWQPPYSNVWALAIDETLHRLFVTVPPTTIGSFSGVQVLDADTGSLLGQASTGARAALVAVDPDTHKVFVTDSSGGVVTVLDGATMETLAQKRPGGGVHGVVWDPQRRAAYVASFTEGTITCIDPAVL